MKKLISIGLLLMVALGGFSGCNSFQVKEHDPVTFAQVSADEQLYELPRGTYTIELNTATKEMKITQKEDEGMGGEFLTSLMSVGGGLLTLALGFL